MLTIKESDKWVQPYFQEKKKQNIFPQEICFPLSSH